MLGRVLVPALFILFLTGCGSEELSIKNFDTTSWKSDKYGCKNDRTSHIKTIKDNKELLLKRTQNEIKDYLGAPDEHELYERTRKFFYYYLEPSDNCNENAMKKPRILQIRFSAMGISNEVFIKNE